MCILSFWNTLYTAISLSLSLSLSLYIYIYQNLEVYSSSTPSPQSTLLRHHSLTSFLLPPISSDLYSQTSTSHRSSFAAPASPPQPSPPHLYWILSNGNISLSSYLRSRAYGSARHISGSGDGISTSSCQGFALTQFTFVTSCLAAYCQVVNRILYIAMTAT